MASGLREAFRLERPPPPTPATSRLRRLILLTAMATVVVDLVNLGYAEEAGFGLAVRTLWAALRALGFLFLMRGVRYGRLGARPFGLILAATTVFASARLVQPRDHGFLPPWPVLLGVAVLTALCGTIVWHLFRSPAIEAHLTRRPPRRRMPAWVLTARVAALSYGPLLLVPCVIAITTLFGVPRVNHAVAVTLIAAWLTGTVVLALLTSIISFAVLFGKRWARVLLAGISLLVLVAQPTLCWLLLGVDSVIRDGVPLMIAAVLCLVGLWRTRADPGGRLATPPTANGTTG
jgi:hypothetical protein